LTPCVKVERNYIDLINKTTIEAKSDFIEKLTHDSYVVQVERITDRFSTKLDMLLSVFEQRNFVDDKKITKEYTHTTDHEDVKILTDLLHYTGTNPKEKKEIETEQEAWRTVNAMREDLLQKLKEKDQALSEKDRLIAELLKKIEDKK
jgi:hypothetical protein